MSELLHHFMPVGFHILLSIAQCNKTHRLISENIIFLMTLVIPLKIDVSMIDTLRYQDA